MDIEIVVGGTTGAPGEAGVRRWHARLAERIAALPGVELSTSVVAGPRPVRGADLLFRLEGLLYGVPPGHPAEPVAPTALPGRPADGRRDLVVDLTGAHRAEAAVLRLRCNGSSVDVGTLDAVLAGVTPVLALDLVVDGVERPVGRWPVAVMEPDVALRGVVTVFGRAIQLVHDAVAAAVVAGDPRSLAAAANGMPVAASRLRRSAARFAATALAARVAGRIRRHLGRAPNWFVGWRRLPAPATGLPDLAGATYRRLPDDGARFFADPFPIHRDGRDYLFVEEFPYATERGVVSVLEILPDGSTTPPRVVLEAETHMSYPFLLEHDGDVFMIPETARKGRVELWRATAFPYKWEQAAVLIDGVDLVDATVVRHAGRWYLFASPREEWTSNWEALAVWSAPDLLGPWEPLPSNPVLVDVRSARPGGAVLRVDGRLVRPVQDCAAGYGAALGWAHVDRLDAEGFSQTLRGRNTAPPPLSGLHTYNRSGRLDVIDVYGPRSVTKFTLGGSVIGPG